MTLFIQSRGRLCRGTLLPPRPSQQSLENHHGNHHNRLGGGNTEIQRACDYFMSFSFRDLVFGGLEQAAVEYDRQEEAPTAADDNNNDSTPVETVSTPPSTRRTKRRRSRPPENKPVSKITVKKSHPDANLSSSDQEEDDNTDYAEKHSVHKKLHTATTEHAEQVILRRLRVLYDPSTSTDMLSYPSLPSTLQSPASLGPAAPVKPHPMVIRNPHIPAAQLPHYPSPARPRRRRRQRKQNENLGENEQEDDGEDPAKVAALARKRASALQRQDERKRLRRRWKKRRIDLRAEADVGGAIRNAVAATFHTSQPGDATFTTKRSLQKSEESGEEKDGDDDPDDDDSNMKVMKRLTQNSAPTKRKHRWTADAKEEGAGFWEKGEVFPNIELSLYRPQYLPKISRKHQSPVDAHDQDKYPGLRIRANPRLRERDRFGGYDPTGLLPPFLPQSNIRFRHKRQILRLAGQCLACPRASRMGQFELYIADQLLRLLWDPNMLEASSHALIDGQAKRCGEGLIELLSQNFSALEKSFPDGEIWQHGVVLAPQAQRMKTAMSRSTVNLLETSSKYLHVVNKVPPIPNHPINALGVEFGPIDKFNFMWRKQQVPEEAMQLTLSTLFSRWMACESFQNDQKTSLEYRMYNMLDNSTRLNDNKVRERLRTRKDPIDELPAVEMYKSVMLFCNLIGSNGGYSFPTSQEADTEATDSQGLRAAARQLFECLEPKRQHSGMNAFPRFHLAHAISQIAKELPDEAILILCTPIHTASSLISPFQLIQRVLEYLEEKGLLVESKSPDSDEIDVGSLEYLFFLACESILKCIEVEPTEPDYLAWYVAMKAGSLLLCSGNRIGSGARLHPSSKKKKEQDDILFDMMDESVPEFNNHEARPMLLKFDETRLETVKGFRLLLTLAKVQQSSRSHLGLVSLLEWKEVIALLVGGSASVKSLCSQVRSMHKQLARRWAFLEQSSVAIRYLQSSDEMSGTLSLLADQLERSPEDVEVWCSLTRALGALQPSGEDDVDDSVLPGDILACPSVESIGGSDCNRDDDEILPDTSKKSVRDVPIWVRDRISWWGDQLLHISVPETIRNKHGSNKPAKLRGDLRVLRSQLQDWLREKVAAEKHGGFNDESWHTSPPDYDTVAWLEACLHQKDANYLAASEKERETLHDGFLPQSINSIVENTAIGDLESLKRPFLTLKNLSPPLQVTCYRLLIRCHIYGTADPIACQSINYFICSIWNSQDCNLDTAHDHCRVLEFCHSMGVDVLRVIPSLSPRESRDLLTWPLEMRRVVKDHVKPNSRPHWKLLQESHPSIFAGCHERKAELCYQFLQKKGLL